MEAEDLLSLMTLGAVAPYALEALFRRLGRTLRTILVHAHQNGSVFRETAFVRHDK